MAVLVFYSYFLFILQPYLILVPFFLHFLSPILLNHNKRDQLNPASLLQNNTTVIRI